MLQPRGGRATGLSRAGPSGSIASGWTPYPFPTERVLAAAVLQWPDAHAACPFIICTDRTLFGWADTSAYVAADVSTAGPWRVRRARSCSAVTDACAGGTPVSDEPRAR